MEQPHGFKDSTQPNHVCFLKHALYSVQQAPRTWFDCFSLFLLSIGFFCSTSDSFLFVSRSMNATILLFLYVDGLILTGDNPFHLKHSIALLSRKCANYTISMESRFIGLMFNERLLFNQVKYSIDLLKHAQMAGCKSISIPMMSKLHPPLHMVMAYFLIHISIRVLLVDCNI